MCLFEESVSKIRVQVERTGRMKEAICHCEVLLIETAGLTHFSWNTNIYTNTLLLWGTERLNTRLRERDRERYRNRVWERATGRERKRERKERGTWTEREGWGRESQRQRETYRLWTSERSGIKLLSLITAVIVYTVSYSCPFHRDVMFQVRHSQNLTSGWRLYATQRGIRMSLLYPVM